MKGIEIFHYLSHARWLFLVWSVFLVVQAFFNPKLYALTNTGLAVFLAGLFLGFWGFSDIEKLSKNEKKEFATPNGMRINTIVFMIMSALSFIMGLYMMSIKAFMPAMEENMAMELKTVGYHCFALGFGFLCYLKMMFDKYKYYTSLPDAPSASDSTEDMDNQP